MVFSSLLFLFQYLPVVILLYFIVPKRFRNVILFAVSLFFYGWGEPVYMVLLLFSTLVDFIHGQLITYFKERSRVRAAKLALTLAMVINLSLLGFFKYSDFLIGAVNQISGSQFPLLHLALPIGISFYTFQTMSYSIDIYRGEARVQKNIIAFGAYVSMFPQLIAGPIVRYQTIAEELNDRKETTDRFALGVRIFVIGLGKKVLLANPMGSLWDQIHAVSSGEQTAWMLWLGIMAYGMQIYFDFSGYSDMAVGLGHMFGFTFPENFNYPYTSKSVTEFWRRWHISLSTWFKEYVYIPLGGNRKGKGRQIVNILVVWLLTGIWHGAGWNFVLWGLYFGLWLLVEKLWLQPYLEKLPSGCRYLYTLVIVFLGWVLFSHDNMGEGLDYLAGMFGAGGRGWSFSGRTAYLVWTALPQLILCIIGSTSLPKRCFMRWQSKSSRWRDGVAIVGLLGIMLLVIAALVDASYNPFLYFRF